VNDYIDKFKSFIQHKVKQCDMHLVSNK